MEKKATFGLQILSADGVFFEGRAVSVTIPCADGSMQLLANHEEMIVAIYQGMMKILTEDNALVEALVGNGSCQIANNRCIILASTVEKPEEIDVNRAKRALEEAQEHMRSQQSIREYHLSQAAMARALSRLRAAKEYHSFNT